MDNQLAIAMSAAVPLHIMRLQGKGGPTEEDMKKAQETSDILGEHGNILIHGGGKKGDQAEKNRDRQYVRESPVELLKPSVGCDYHLTVSSTGCICAQPDLKWTAGLVIM